MCKKKPAFLWGKQVLQVVIIQLKANANVDLAHRILGVIG